MVGVGGMFTAELSALQGYITEESTPDGKYKTVARESSLRPQLKYRGSCALPQLCVWRERVNLQTGISFVCISHGHSYILVSLIFRSRINSVVNKAWERNTGGVRKKTPDPSWSIRLDHIFNGSPAYRTACIDLSLQFQTAVVAQTHVSAGVDNSVHLLVKANGAFSIFTSRGQLRSRETGRVRWA